MCWRSGDSFTTGWHWNRGLFHWWLYWLRKWLSVWRLSVCLCGDFNCYWRIWVRAICADVLPSRRADCRYIFHMPPITSEDLTLFRFHFVGSKVQLFCCRSFLPLFLLWVERLHANLSTFLEIWQLMCWFVIILDLFVQLLLFLFQTVTGSVRSRECDLPWKKNLRPPVENRLNWLLLVMFCRSWK